MPTHHFQPAHYHTTLGSHEPVLRIADGDTVIMRGHCEADGIRIGFGEVSGKLLPAKG